MNQKEEVASAIAADLHHWECNDQVVFTGKRQVCKNCKFCDFIVHDDEFNSYGFNSYECICKFMPTPVKKSPKDWCVQYEESKIDLDYILSFDVDKILRKGWII